MFRLGEEMAKRSPFQPDEHGSHILVHLPDTTHRVPAHSIDSVTCEGCSLQIRVLTQRSQSFPLLSGGSGGEQRLCEDGIKRKPPPPPPPSPEFSPTLSKSITEKISEHENAVPPPSLPLRRLSSEPRNSEERTDGAAQTQGKTNPRIC